MPTRQQREPAFDAALWELVRRTSATSGRDLFLELTRSLSAAVGVQYCAVGEVVGAGTVRTLALWTGQEWEDNLEYALDGTPCGRVVECRGLRFYGRGVSRLFPEDRHLKDWNVESYVGAPLLSSTGDVIGHLCLLDPEPLPDQERATAIVDTFATRAAAELDRIRTEVELERQRASLRQVLDINPSLIFVKDREGRFTLVNQSIADAYGTTIEDLTGKTDADFNPNEEEVAFFRKIDLEVMDTRRERFIPEEPVTQASGEVRWVQTIKRPIVGADGRADHVLGVATDVTELKRAREELLERQRREQEKVQDELHKVKDELVRQTRLAAIGQVAASIAHELRNPLGAINNAVFYLRRRVPRLEPKWAEYLGIIAQEVQRSDGIVGNLLEMSRAKEPSKEPVDLGAVLRETFDQIRGDDPFELTVALEPDPFVVAADAGHLRQVLGNLITNAFQAMNGGGTIRVTGRRDDGWDRVRLSDDGPGISADDRDHVFEPLFTTKAKGTGLGLPICRQIIEKHGGEIELVDSDRGAAFEIRLPRAGDPA